MNEKRHESFTAILRAYDTLKFKLRDDHFEFGVSDMSPIVSVVDLNCEEEHKELDKIYCIFYSTETQSYVIRFESSLPYKSTFKKEHAATLIEADIDFKIYKHRLHLEKTDVELEDLAENVKLMAEILFNF